MPITYGGDNITFADGSKTTSAYTGFKNRIINGALVIDQRNAGASVSNIAGGLYTLDRWTCFGSQASKFTVQQNAGSVTPPVGFTNYLGITSSSAYSVGSSEAFRIAQWIEGFNIADLGFGTANAKTITVSFWVRSSLTGTFGGQLLNSSADRAYPFTYTISSANTWEQKSVTIAGDTSGTWNTTNGPGLLLGFGLGYGSSISGTANVWNAGTAFMPTGATSVVGTNGATFYITGVQLEPGSSASTFDYRPYGTELALCQRYCQVYGGFANQRFTVGWWFNTTDSYCQLYAPVNFRSPSNISMSYSALGDFRVYNAGSPLTPTDLILDSVGQNCITLRQVVSTGGTAGYAAVMLANSTSAKLTFLNEL